MPRSQFDIIPSHNIDAAKWDNCIVQSEANNIYARYIYLQHMADNWSGLVMDDYAAVMPIVWRRKWGIRYCYSAPFIQQLGLFGEYNAVDLQEVTDIVTRYIKYGDLFFNHTNKKIQQIVPEAKAATNLIIPLNTGYELIHQGYTNHLKNKLKKAAAQSLQYLHTDEVELAVHTYRQLYAARLPSVKAAHYKRLMAVAKQLATRQQCFVRKVMDKTDKLPAIALFFKDESRIYNILPSTTAAGKKHSAMHFLIDNLIKEFAGTPLIFDFEGSDLPGIKAFYESFGAVNQPYYHLHYNHLYIPFKWLKR